MFFHNADLRLQLIEVFAFEQGKTVTVTSPRKMCALSFRLEAKNTTFESEHGVFSLEKGDLLFSPDHMAYTRRCDHDKVIVAHFVCDEFRFSQLERFRPQNAQTFQSLFLRLLSAYESERTGYAATAVLYEILAAIAKENDTRRNDDRKRIEVGVQLMESAYADPQLSVAKISKECGLSEVSFRLLFEKTMGMRPSTYLTKLKVQKAIRLLSVGGFKMDEIAELTGFCDAKYFATVFKKVTGVSPKEYRNPKPARFDGVVRNGIPLSE